MTRLAIVVVSFNARDALAGTLQSLTAAPPAATHEIVVVDNASTDGAPELVRSRFPTVRVIPAGGNLGFARANNLGIRATASELILLLNPDTIVPPDAIDRLVARLDRSADVAAIGPRIVDQQGAAELSNGARVTPWREAGRKTVTGLAARGNAAARRWIDRQTREEREVEWVTGACLLVRRADAEAAGLMDERFFLYFEDVDLCAALRANGRRILFSPVAEIVHLRGRSETGHGRARAAWHESQLAYYRKHLPYWVPLLRLYQSWTPGGRRT